MTAKRPYRETSKSAIYTLTEDLIFVDETYERTSDFKHQTYRNREYLTFSRSFSTGVSNPGHGYGKTVFLDYEYQSIEFDFDEPILSLICDQPVNLDLHEHIMAGPDTVSVTACNNTPYELSPLGPPRDGWLVNSMFFVVEPPMGRVVSSWSAIGHILLSDSLLHYHHTWGMSLKVHRAIIVISTPFSHLAMIAC
jgi:hypothetical protein